MNYEKVGEIKNGKYVGTPATDKQKLAFAQMLALRQAPRALTDRELFHSQGTLDKQHSEDPEGLKRRVKAAMKHGYRPNPNDMYIPALADFPGDPKAFVSPSGGRGQIQKVLEERNLSADGIVERKREKQPVKRKRLADDLVKQGVCDMVRANPDLRRVNKYDLAAEVIHKHGSKETD